MEIDGQCHCGYLAYQATADPNDVAICHCTDCQSLSGTAFRTAIRIPNHHFRMLTGEPTIYVKTTDRGKKTAQAFCPRCGSQVYARHVEDAKFYAVRVGTVRQRNELEPKVQVWARSRVPWLNKLGSIRELDEQ